MQAVAEPENITWGANRKFYFSRSQCKKKKKKIQNLTFRDFCNLRGGHGPCQNPVGPPLDSRLPLGWQIKIVYSSIPCYTKTEKEFSFFFCVKYYYCSVRQQWTRKVWPTYSKVKIKEKKKKLERLLNMSSDVQQVYIWCLFNLNSYN